MTVTPTVLVVEDDALIRLSVVDALMDVGVEVYEAASAAEALLLLRREKDFALIFTDIDMPGAMNGIGLAQTVSEQWPSMWIMITSGMNQPSQGVLPSGATFIPKPYMLDYIAQDIRARLTD